MESGWEVPERGDVCTRIADSFSRTAETNNTVKQLYSIFFLSVLSHDSRFTLEKYGSVIKDVFSNFPTFFFSPK